MDHARKVMLAVPPTRKYMLHRNIREIGDDRALRIRILARIRAMTIFMVVATEGEPNRTARLDPTPEASVQPSWAEVEGVGSGCRGLVCFGVQAFSL